MIWVTRVVKVTQSEEQKGKREQNKKTKKVAHEGPSFCGRGRSSRVKQTSFPESASPLPAYAHPAARCPRKVSSSGVETEEPEETWEAVN